MTDADSQVEDDGSLGVLASPSWSSRWSSMSLQHKDECFREAAQLPLLSQNQMEQLLQGLPPALTAWPSTNTLVEFEGVVQRLRADISSGAFPTAATPSEFAAWCDFYAVELHSVFVEQLRELERTPLVKALAQTAKTYVGPRAC